MNAWDELRTHLRARFSQDQLSPGEAYEQTGEAIHWVCEQIDTLRTQNDELRRAITELAANRVEDRTIIDRFAAFLAEWNTRLPFNQKTKLEFVAERILHYDRTIQELTKRIEEWGQLKDKFRTTLEQFERIMKGEQG